MGKDNKLYQVNLTEGEIDTICAILSYAPCYWDSWDEDGECPVKCGKRKDGDNESGTCFELCRKFAEVVNAT